MLRRDFLSAGLRGLAASTLASSVWSHPVALGAHDPGLHAENRTAEDRQAAPDNATARPPIVDTHTHFYDPTRPEGVPWPSPNNALLYRPMLPKEFRGLAQPLGVVGTVVVEASPWVEDNDWLLKLADADPFLLGIVGRLDTRSANFAEQLTRLAKNPRYRGIRISANELSEGLAGQLVERCQLLVDHNLELDVNGGPDMPLAVARLAARLPDLRIVINHAANQRVDGRLPPPAYREAMQAAAKYPRVFCKVSALVEQAASKPAPPELEYYRPALDTLWNLFGEERLIYGSNWPVCLSAASYETVLKIVQSYFHEKGPAAATKFFQGNAQLAYAWPKRSA